MIEANQNGMAKQNSQMSSEDIPFYMPLGSEVDVFEHAYRRQLPLLLKGPTGCGKTRFVEHMAARLGRPLITVSCHDETSAVDLIGRYVLKGNETLWQNGPLIHAVETGSILYIDEIAEARPDTVVVLHSLTDNRRMLYNDRLNKEYQAPPEFMLVASYNPGYQSAWKELKQSTKQRFVSMSFGYPPAEVEKAVIEAESGCEPADAKRLVKAAAAVRNLTELGLTESASTRLLVDAGKLIADGLPKLLSCQVAICEPLTDDNDTKAALMDVLRLHF